MVKKKNRNTMIVVLILLGMWAFGQDGFLGAVTSPEECQEGDSSCVECTDRYNTCRFSSADNVWIEKEWSYANGVCAPNAGFVSGPYDTEFECDSVASRVGVVCLNDNILCTDTIWRESDGALFCDVSDFFNCEDNGFDSCSDNECISSVCNAGFEVCSDGSDFTNYDEEGDVYKCDSDGQAWTREDSCSSSETCMESTSTRAVCEPGETFYCISSGTTDCQFFQGNNPPDNCYSSQQQCDAQFVWCFDESFIDNSFTDAAFGDSQGSCTKRIGDCEGDEVEYNTEQECIDKIILNSCGNNVCGTSETCESCPEDCGELISGTIIYECPDDTEEECTQNSDCTTNEICQNNICIDEPVACTEDSDCETNQECINNICKDITSPPPGTTVCTEDTVEDVCAEDEVCVSDLCVSEEENECAPWEKWLDADNDGVWKSSECKINEGFLLIGALFIGIVLFSKIKPRG